MHPIKTDQNFSYPLNTIRPCLSQLTHSLNTIRPCLSQLTHSLIHWQFACDLIFKWISWLQCLDTVLSIWPATNLLQRSVRDLAYFMVSLPETWPKSRWVSQRETWPISWWVSLRETWPKSQWVSQRPGLSHGDVGESARDLFHGESPRDLAYFTVSLPETWPKQGLF